MYSRRRPFILLRLVKQRSLEGGITIGTVLIAIGRSAYSNAIL